MKRILAKSKIVVVLASVATLFLGQSAQAQTNYWNGTGTTWDTSTDWSTASGATTPNPSTPPGSGNDVVFNVSTVNTAQTITVGATDAANSLTFASTGTTSFLGGSLTIGSGGLTIDAGAGAVSVGTGGTTFVIGASQEWINNSSNSMNFTSPGIATASGLTSPITLTFGGGAFSVRGGFADSSGGGALSIVVTGGTALTINPNAGTFTGGTSIENGSVRTSSASGLGTGAISLGFTSGTAGAELTYVNSGTIANNFTVLSNGTSTLVAGGGGNTYTFNTGTITLSNTLNLSSSASGTTTMNFDGLITGTGGLNVNTSAGHAISTVNIDNANTYTGGTTISTSTIVAQNTAAFGAAGASLNLSGGAVDLQTDTSINAYNTTVTGNTTIDSDKATAASAGITQTLGTLNIGAGTLSIGAGANVSGGTAIVAFGATTLTGNGATTTFTPTTSGLTLTSVVGSALSTKKDVMALNGSNTNNAITGTISDGSGGGTVGVTAGGTGAWTLSGDNTYSGGTTVSGGTVYANNATSSTGTGVVAVNSGGTLAGSGTIAATTTTTAAVTVATGGIIMPGGVQTTVPFTGTPGTLANGNLTLNPLNVTGTSQLFNAAKSTNTTSPSLVFALGASSSSSQIVAGGTAANVFNFNVGGTSATSTVVSINDLVGANLTLNQSYVLIQGNGDTTFEDNGVALSVGAGSLNASGMIIGGLSLLAPNTSGNFFSQWYDSSELFFDAATDSIDVEVIPEPGTWAMMLGGFVLLIVVQRRKWKLGD